MNDNNFYMLLPLIAILNSKRNRGPSDRLTDTSVLFMEGQGRGLNICRCWMDICTVQKRGRKHGYYGIAWNGPKYLFQWTGAVFWMVGGCYVSGQEK